MYKPQVKLPSLRNIDAFIHVAIEGRTCADAAREMGLRQRSVETMVASVRTWMRKHGAVWAVVARRLL